MERLGNHVLHVPREDSVNPKTVPGAFAIRLHYQDIGKNLAPLTNFMHALQQTHVPVALCPRKSPRPSRSCSRLRIHIHPTQFK